MRIIHVVTLVTPDGSLGGPLRVAVNQISELQKAGHEVILAAGAQGYDESFPDTYDGVSVKLFSAYNAVPGTGFAGLISPELMSWLWKAAPTADVVHVHMARDLITLPAARIAQLRGVPTVIQTHGMIDVSERPLAKPLDAVATRAALRKAKAVLALTKLEKSDLLEVAPNLDASNVSILHNGVPSTNIQASAGREPIEVLFLARLQERKRPLKFVKVAQELAKRFPEVRFSLVGPDEGQGMDVRAQIVADDADGRIRWEGSLPAAQTLERMSRASIYVLPSENEPYGMTVVEAMSVGLPVVVMEDCGLATSVEDHKAGLVADYSEKGLEESIAALLEDSDLRAKMGRQGKSFVENFCSMKEIADQLQGVYRKVTL